MPTPSDSPALKYQSPIYPARYRGRVPRRVRMARTVRGDVPAASGRGTAERGLEYDVTVNSHGAVAALLAGGFELGLKPDEFDVTAWHETERNETP